VIGKDAISQSEFCRSELCQLWLIFKMETSKRHQIPTTNACKNFSFRGLRIKEFITLDFRDSTLTYAQESIFSLTNHSAIVCDSTSVTISCDRQKYRLVSSGNGQLSTRTLVILLWAQPVVGLRPTYRACARYKTVKQEHRGTKTACAHQCPESTIIQLRGTIGMAV